MEPVFVLAGNAAQEPPRTSARLASLSEPDEERAMGEGPTVGGSRAAAWYDGWTEGQDALFAGRAASPGGEPAYRTLTYEVTGRIARITFNRPEQGNAITLD